MSDVVENMEQLVPIPVACTIGRCARFSVNANAVCITGVDVLVNGESSTPDTKPSSNIGMTDADARALP